jgi:hypothetical protein
VAWIWRAGDVRVDVRAAAFGDSTDYSELPLVSNSKSGNRATITVLVPFAIPAATDSFAGLRVISDITVVAVYPNDAVDAPLDVQWLLTAPATDPDTSNNSETFAGYTDESPATPWGVLVDATFEKTEIVAGTSYAYRATTVTLTSVGPTPAVAGGMIQLLTDSRISSAISFDNIELNSNPAGSAIVFDHDDTSGNFIYKYYRNAVDLAAGDIVTFDVSYTDANPSTVPTDLGFSQIAFNGLIANDPDRRAQDRGFVNDPDHQF